MLHLNPLMSALRNPPRNFATRAEHEAALDQTDRDGPQPGILYCELLPSLPLPPDAIASLAALNPTGSGKWFDLLVEPCDGRAPSRENHHTARAVRLLGQCAVIILRRVGAGGHGLHPVLIDARGPAGAVERDLVYTRSGKHVRFEAGVTARPSWRPSSLPMAPRPRPGRGRPTSQSGAGGSL
jgi:hypothetical protein